MSVFITVGSTRFDQLVNVVLSETIQKELRLQGYHQITIQHGSSPIYDKPRLTAFAYAPNLKPFMEEASLIITHAGSGTLLEILRDLNTKPKLIVVINEHLMDNHQQELAMALASQGICQVTTPNGLLSCLKEDARLTGNLPPPQTKPVLARIIADLLR